MIGARGMVNHAVDIALKPSPHISTDPIDDDGAMELVAEFPRDECLRLLLISVVCAFARENDPEHIVTNRNSLVISRAAIDRVLMGFAERLEGAPGGAS